MAADSCSFERGYCPEFELHPELALEIRDHFWSPHGNPRQLRDAGVIRGAFDPRYVQAEIDRFHCNSQSWNSRCHFGVHGLGQVVGIVRQVNRLLGIKERAGKIYRISGGIDPHIDMKDQEAGIRYKGLVASCGLTGPRTFGFGVIERHWEEISGDVFDSTGNFPDTTQLRTIIVQDAGDVVFWPHGKIHGVNAPNDHRALIIAESIEE